MNIRDTNASRYEELVLVKWRLDSDIGEFTDAIGNADKCAIEIRAVVSTLAENSDLSSFQDALKLLDEQTLWAEQHLLEAKKTAAEFEPFFDPGFIRYYDNWLAKKASSCT